jgi:hypothetical protein
MLEVGSHFALQSEIRVLGPNLVDYIPSFDMTVTQGESRPWSREDPARKHSAA